MRTPLIIGNWKMHKTIREARSFLADLAPRLTAAAAQVGIAPAFTALPALGDAAWEAGLELYAQNMHERPFGPYTGEISAPMLTELDIAGVILGHSERRRYFGETDGALRHKVPVALAAGLRPVLCVGESTDERERGDTHRRLREQIQHALADVQAERLADEVIAYEPPSAIGSSTVSASLQAQDASAFLRALIADRSPAAASRTRILYGSWVSPHSAPALLDQRDIDGLLVGAASLDVESFAAIVAAGPAPATPPT